MKSIMRTLMLLGLVMGLSLCLTIPASAKIIPRVTNFVILVDQSGSMFMNYDKGNRTKAALAKETPTRRLIGPETYSRAFFRPHFQALPTEGKVYRNLTALGPAISDTDNVLQLFTGSRMVVLVSDGRATEGGDPVEAAKALYAKYPNLCIHVVSLADEDKGREVLKTISGMGNCVYAEGSDLLSDPTALQNFLSQTFYEEIPDEALVAILPPPAKPPGTLEIITIHAPYFDFDSAEINADYIPALDLVVDKLASNPNLSIVIEGHTDSTGPAEYNQKLSERRAQAVQAYLLKKGVPADRMTVIGWGESRPRISNLTREGRAANRRVEIRVLERTGQ
ncbi:MAG: OmpA family protein [Deltaproteobacteria bacterium]|nr:OmpA family protein [Deltaproteobacteria bacterium]